MILNKFIDKAEFYLQTLCAVHPHRRTGSIGNRTATDFFSKITRSYGYKIDAAPFECLDHICSGASLYHGDESFDVHASPYTLGCDNSAELVCVSTIEELENCDSKEKLLLMKGEICSEQLMPKNFIFYNPEHHQQIISLLESQKPAGIITATERKPDQVGALYPFPLIVDGDFDIPNVYCRDEMGEILAAKQNMTFRLKIDARRLHSTATNIIARCNTGSAKKIVFTAHIDAYEGSAGASDNASGIVVLLLCSEMLSDYQGEYCIEIAALNGEDHYSAAGQMDYLRRYENEFPRISLVMNIDDIGYKKGRSSYSFYQCDQQLENKAEETFRQYNDLVHGEPWYNGDHMIFVQNHLPAIAFTSECMSELMATVTHTSADTPEIIDCHKMVEVACALNALVRAL